MLLHGLLNFFPGGARLQTQLAVQRVKFEKVAVEFAVWWTWPAIAELFEIIEALFGAAWNILRLRCALGQLAGIRRQIVEDPVCPGSTRRVGVVGDQGESFGLCWHAAPFQRRRNILIIASVFSGNGRAFIESSAGQLDVALVRF